MDHSEVCDNLESCTFRREQIQLTKGFAAKESVKGHMMNVVKGLKMFDNVFTVAELCKLRTFVDELRVAGETYILFNKQVKTNKREQIQLGVPLFGHVKDEATNEQQKSNNEPIPELIQSVIDHLPNGCIINYFDEGEYSQPFLKPPHLDHPPCTLVLSESTVAFGRSLVNDGDGNFKAQLMLSMKEGSVLVMRNNSADVARHVMCASPTKRVSITLIRIRPDQFHTQHPTLQPMTLWQPAGMPGPQTLQNGPPVDAFPKWGVVRAPLVMLAPVRPMAVTPRRMPHGGTGVFLPWTVGLRKPARHLPPCAQL
ncbi:hypothetical protein RND81_02G181800 [Saponaria officinalis]|uniref:Fe2OG dioxygenase domain-containing protein n=1 Tax=Saponaria officinalis TaxID=3572 RepID=A0AAW1MX40_SAPOF